MIQVSTNGRYALRLMLDLALNQGQGPVRREDMAARQEISSDYIAQLFRRLSQAGLARGVKGPGGGYVLGHEPKDITIGDVIRAAEGPISLVHCVEADEVTPCSRMDGCVTSCFWASASHELEKFLDGSTLQDLCNQASVNLR